MEIFPVNFPIAERIIAMSRSCLCLVLFLGSFAAAGCTVKAVGDPNRPITINAHITLDIKGLQNTAVGIEDYVSGKTSKDSLPVAK